MVRRDSCRFLLCVGFTKTVRRKGTCALLRIMGSSLDLGCTPKLCNLAVLNYAGMVEAEAVLRRYYYMVVHPHIYGIERLYDIARHFDILTAGCRVAAWMIVHKYNTVSLCAQTFFHNKPRINGYGIDGSLGKLHRAQQLAFAVKAKQIHAFIFYALIQD